MQVALADVSEQQLQRLLTRRVLRVDQSGRVSGEAVDRRQRQRDVELQRWTVHAQHLGQRFADLPQPLLRSNIHAHCGLAAQLRIIEQVGQSIGLIVVGGQLHQQQPVTLYRCAHP